MIKPPMDQLQLGRRTPQISLVLGVHVCRGAAWQREVDAGGEDGRSQWRSVRETQAEAQMI